MFRRKTKEVFIGNVAVGGDNPVRIQSMTTTLTKDIEATVKQTKELADNGCEIVRFTVQGMQEALACEHIKDRLLQHGYSVPLVADIHFFPAAALKVVDFVEKVRINPGNFADKRNMFSFLDKQDEELFSEEKFNQHLSRMENKLAPLVEKCKKQNKCLRIGVNHGSLSERVMQKYGDTIEGMVISALEYMHICHKLNFREIIFSMKSSNPQIMIAAYRSLCRELDILNSPYPLHLGVTEAGDGLDGRVKSAIGIGSLLLEGIGDTIRTSLTEDSVNEIIPCKHLINLSEDRLKYLEQSHRQPFASQEFKVFSSLDFEKHNASASLKHMLLGIELELQDTESNEFENILDTYFSPDQEHNILIISEELADLPWFSLMQKKQYRYVVKNDRNTLRLPLSTEIINARPSSSEFFLITTEEQPRVDIIKEFFLNVKSTTDSNKYLVYFNYEHLSEKTAIYSGAEFGSLLNDNLSDGIIIAASQLSLEDKLNLGLSLLQATRKRFTKTEFIACPMCGRTLFDLPSVLEKIKKRTAHLPGLKIAVMGCVVNGPGEMADADFGFVGSQPGKVDLYVKHKCVRSHIDMEDAEEALIDLLKEHGVWKEVVTV